MNKSALGRLAGMVVPVLLLSACASTGDEKAKPSLEQRLSDRGYVAGGNVERVDNYRIAGYNTIDDEHLILNAGASRYFLITLRTPCSGIQNVEDLGFTTTTFALTRFDAVKFKQTGIDRTCQIDTIRSLEQLKKPG